MHWGKTLILWKIKISFLNISPKEREKINLMSLNVHGPRSPVHPLRLELEPYNFGQWDDTTKKHRPFVITKGIPKDVSSYVELRSISFKLSSISPKGQTINVLII